MMKTFATRFAAWRRERETIRELSLLSNRELSDLGIGRGDIPFIAAGLPLASEDEMQAHRAPDRAALIGPTWAAHAPTSLAA